MDLQWPLAMLKLELELELLVVAMESVPKVLLLDLLPHEV